MTEPHTAALEGPEDEKCRLCGRTPGRNSIVVFAAVGDKPKARTVAHWERAVVCYECHQDSLSDKESLESFLNYALNRWREFLA
jgi:hypothetical protein